MLTFEESTLQTILDIKDYLRLCDLVNLTAVENPEILGILLTGSLVQRIKLPSPYKKNFQEEDITLTYKQIVGRARRKLWPHYDSDLDIWICTEESKKNENLSSILNKRGVSLLDWLCKNPKASLDEWIRLKHEKFDDFYKVEKLYPSSWLKRNPKSPWLATDFKHKLIERVNEGFPLLEEKINYYFRKKFVVNF